MGLEIEKIWPRFPAFSLRSFLPRRLLVKQTVSKEGPDRLESVPPCNFLAVFVGAPAVGNWVLVDPISLLGHLRRDFWLEVEAIGLDYDLFEDLSPKDLVTSFHVRQIQVSEHVG